MPHKSQTPAHYRVGADDLYERHRMTHGYERTARHLLMRAEEYIHRAPLKGEYVEDLAKVVTIMERLLLWTEAYGFPPFLEKDAANLTDEIMAEQLRLHGWTCYHVGAPVAPPEASTILRGD